MNHAVIGLGFGDCGKGKLVDYLCRTYDCDYVVRFNGGGQASHNVVLPDNRHHSFSQFGAGSFVPGVKTLLSKFHLLDPISLIHEANILSDKLGIFALSNHFIDERCMVVTPYHVIANRERESLAGKDRHGSVGKGIGECVGDSLDHPEDIIWAWELRNPEVIIPKLERTAFRKGQSYEFNDDLHPYRLAAGYDEVAGYLNIIGAEEVNYIIGFRKLVFEGAQGVLLDQDIGFAPHNTWSCTTDSNVRKLLKEANCSTPLEVIGVTRCYHTRHGAGPFPSYHAIMDDFNPVEHNDVHEFQGPFRSGGFDLSLFNWAIRHCNLDSLCVNHLDLLGEVPCFRSESVDNATTPFQVGKIISNNTDYKQCGVWRKTKEVIRAIEIASLFVPVKYVGYGPTNIELA